MTKTTLAIPFGLMIAASVATVTGCAHDQTHADTPSAGESTVGAPKTTTAAAPGGQAGNASTTGTNGSSGATTGGPGEQH